MLKIKPGCDKTFALILPNISPGDIESMRLLIKAEPTRAGTPMCTIDYPGDSVTATGEGFTVRLKPEGTDHLPCGVQLYMDVLPVLSDGYCLAVETIPLETVRTLKGEGGNG